MRDVEQLLAAHARLDPGGVGKKQLGHFARSAVVMLCAALEGYMQDLAQESVARVTASCEEPTQLGRPIQKSLASGAERVLAGRKHQLALLDMTGNRWKSVYRTACDLYCRGFRSPKSHACDDLFRQVLGISTLSAAWAGQHDSRDLDSLVDLRHDIVHLRRRPLYPRLVPTEQHVELVSRIVTSTDNYVSDYLKQAVPLRRKPWNLAKRI